MVRGIQTAANGMMGIVTMNDVISNNLANANTTGFKTSMVTFKNIQNLAIGERLPNTEESKYVGTLSSGSYVDSTLLNMSQGAISKTGNPLDLAISGKGFFEVKTPSGIAYTRNGTFIKNSDGYVTTTDGYELMGEKGPIVLKTEGKDSNNITISSDGTIHDGKTIVDKLNILDFKKSSSMKTLGDSLYQPANNDKPIKAVDYQIDQGALEQANSNVVECMVNSIQGSRTYESLSKVIDASNKSLSKAVNEVGKMKL